MADVIWTRVQVILTDVPIEYMECNADAFTGGDEVVVEFTDQNWDQPKVIGFKENPRACSGAYIFPSYSLTIEPWPIYHYSPTADSWRFINGRPGQTTDNGLSEYGATGEGGIGFLMCGIGLGAIDTGAGFTSDECYSYDSVANSWSTINNHPQDKAWLGCRSLKNGSIITAGGRSYSGPSGDLPWIPSSQTSHSVEDTHEYSIASDSWTARRGGNRVDSFADFVSSGRYYKVGGKTTDFDGSVPDYYMPPADESTLEFYNVENTWHSKQTLNYPLKELNGWNLNGGGFVGGGMYYRNFVDRESSISVCDGDDVNLRTSAMFEYTPITDSWENVGCGAREYPEWGKSELYNETKCLLAGGGGSENYYIYDPIDQTMTNKGSIRIVRNAESTYILFGNGAELGNLL